VWVCQEDDRLDIVGDAHSDADVHGTTVCEVVALEGEYDECCGVGPYFVFDTWQGFKMGEVERVATVLCWNCAWGV
jgi:hypothetical protein